MNIVDELVRIGAFNSKKEARTMIANKGVSLIPCICEDFEITCFEAEEWEQTKVITEKDWHWWTWRAKGIIWNVGKIKFCNGFILAPDGSKIPAIKWNLNRWTPTIAHFVEQLQYGPKAGIRVENYVITWDVDKFGKNPWLLTDDKLEYTLKPGDTIKIGKKRTIVVEE